MKKGFRFIILMLAAFMMPSVVNAEVATVTTDLDFSKNSVQVSYNNPDGEIYWNNNQLLLENVKINGTITVPDQDVTFIIGENVQVNGNIYVKNGNHATLTFTGEDFKINGTIIGSNGSIILDGIGIEANLVSAGNDDSKLILKNNSSLKVENGVSIGGSGSASGSIFVEDNSTISSVGEYASISTGKFIIKDKNSKIYVSVSDEISAVSSGLIDAFDDISVLESSKVYVNGTSYSTITDLNNEPLHTVTLIFKRYVINASETENGVITPSGATNVFKGTNQNYTFTANNGYHVKDVLVDEESVGAVTEYEFTNVITNHNISVIFEKDTKKNTIKNPQTSDKIILYLGLMFLSIVGIASIIIKNKKSNLI